MRTLLAILLSLAMVGCAAPSPKVETKTVYVDRKSLPVEIPAQPPLPAYSMAECRSFNVKTSANGEETRSSCAVKKLWASIEILEKYGEGLRGLLEARNKQ